MFHEQNRASVRLVHLASRLRQSVAAIGVTSLVLGTFPQPAFANPTGGSVVAGSATIATGTPSTLTVDQKTKIVIINWQSFNIGAGETTRFSQPSSSATAVNRIGGADPAQILGNLIANGRVVLIDGNGILFGPNAKVNVGALLATASNASNADIISGKAKFDQAGNPNAKIINNGSITANSGFVGLIAPSVTNNGVVQARLGQVALGASNVFTVDFNGDGLISFPVDPNIVAAAIDENGKPVKAVVANNGRIEARTVLLSSRAAADLVTSVISITGEVVARSVSDHGGEIVLDGGTGAVALAGATLDASGKNGGGSITVGGWNTPSVIADKATVLDASARQLGNGGAIAVIAQNTAFHGAAKAKGGAQAGNGGSVETSGHLLDTTGARVDTTAAHGSTGSWLLDPYNVTISSAATSNASGFAATGDNSIINAADLSAALATTNVAVTTGMSGTQNGDIEVASNINWNSAGNLTLKAWRNVAIDSGITITNSGTGGLTLYADAGANSVGTVSFGNGASAHLASGNMHVYFHSGDFAHPTNYSGYLVGSGSTTGYMLIDTVSDLGVIGGIGEGSYYYGAQYQTYALNADLDLAGAPRRNGDGNVAAGWLPLGTAWNGTAPGPFAGVFDGQNHTISNMTINAGWGNSPWGLFGYNTGTIENLNLTNVSIVTWGSQYLSPCIGALVGCSGGTISNVHASGSISGHSAVGGLVGINYGGTISDSSAAVNVAMDWYGSTGGLVGANYGTITRSSASGSVYTGGIGGSTGGLVGSNNGTITQSFSTGDVTMVQNMGTENSTYVGGFVGTSNGGTISQSYETGAVSATFNDETPENTMAIGVGAFAGTQMPLGGGPNPGIISQSYATGSLFAQNVWTPTCDGCGWGPTRIYTGFVGNTKYGSGVSSSYWDSGTTGLGGGSTTSQMQAALPAGFDPTAWSIVAGETYPYLTWQFPAGTIAISGTVYSDGGTTPLSGGHVSILDNGMVFGGTTSGADGHYSFLAPAAATPGILAYVTSGGGGNSFANAATSSLDITANTVRLDTSAATYSGTIGALSSAVGSHGADSGLLFTLGTGNTLTVAGGTTLYIATHASSFSLDRAVALTGGQLVLDAFRSFSIAAPVSMSGVGSVALIFNHGGTGGSFDFNGGKVTFDNLASTLTIDLNPFTLVGDLATLGTDITGNPSGLYALANDIDESGHGTYSTSPVPTDFSGIFAGMGNTISNLTISDGTHPNVGLFSHVTPSGTVAYVNLTSASVAGTAGQARFQTVGGIAGVNEGQINNVSLSGTIAGGHVATVGGIAGLNNGALSRISVTGTISGGDGSDVGGLAGDSNGTIDTAQDAVTVTTGTTITVNSNTYSPTAGGLVAYQFGGTISNSSSSGTISGGASSLVGGAVGADESGAVLQSVTSSATVGSGLTGMAGGVIGWNKGQLSASSASGAVTGGDGSAAGGLAGWNNGTVQDSFATGAVITGNATATAATSAGGLVGVNRYTTVNGQNILGRILNSYATGQVSSGATHKPSNHYANVGGLVGSNNGTVDGSYATGNVSGLTYADIGGLAGSNASSVTNSHASGTVQGGNYAVIGGLVGYNTSSISTSFAQGAVSAANGAWIGGLVGDNKSTIDQSYATGNITGGNANASTAGTYLGFVLIGGLVGYNEANAGVTNSYAQGSVTAGVSDTTDNTWVLAGGLIGNNAGTITGTHATGATIGGLLSRLGGLVGANTNAIRTSYATGSVTGGDQVQAGGLAGYNSGTVTQSYATGSVTVGASDPAHSSYAMAGGLIGDAGGSIQLSYAQGPVSGGANSVPGGLVGVEDNGGSLQTSYATGAVSQTGGAMAAGGVAGAVLGTIANSVYWDTTTTGLASGIGMTMGGTSNAVALQSANPAGANYAFTMASYSGWNFQTKWSPPTHDATNGTYYPQLYAVSRVAWIVPANASKTYGDANPAFSGNVYGLQGADHFTAQPAYASAAMSSSDVGTYAITASGAVAAGYRMIYDLGTLTINPKQLTASLIGTVEKTYDGTTAATLAASNYNLPGVLQGDTVVLNNPTSGTYGSAGAGGGKMVGVTGLALSGTKAGNYTLAATNISAAIGTIDAKTLTVSLTGTVETTYDGTTTATLLTSNYGLSGIIGGDDVALNNPATGTYDTKNAGSGKAVSVGGLALSGLSALNYSLASTSVSAAVGKIDAKAITASGIVANNKVYDRTTTAMLDLGSAAFSGVIAGDSVGFDTSSLTANFADKNVGVGKSVTVTGLALTNANYALLAQPAGLTASISAATLTASLTGAVSKVYDGTVAATLAASNYGLSGVVSGDTVALNNPATGTYNSKDTAIGKAVSVTGLALGGTDVGNYTLANTSLSAAIGTIAPATLTASLTGAVSKVYDGTVAATLAASNYGLSGVVSGDTVALNNPTAGTYDTKNAGSGKTVTVTSVALTGVNAGNYTLAASTLSGAFGTISPTTLSITANALSKVYGDGDPALTYASSGLVGGDSTSAINGGLTRATGENVGSYAIRIGSLSAGTNYVIAFAPGTLTVMPASLTVTVADASRNFGQTNPDFSATVTGMKSGDAASVVSGINLMTDATVGSLPGAYAITSSGGTATNYVITTRHDGVLTVEAVASSTAGYSGAINVGNIGSGSTTGGGNSTPTEGGLSSGGWQSGTSSDNGFIPNTLGGSSGGTSGQSGSTDNSNGQGNSDGVNGGSGTNGSSGGNGTNGSSSGNDSNGGSLSCLVANSSASCGS